jgi:photosystem II P680 reaction center D1 protein
MSLFLVLYIMETILSVVPLFLPTSATIGLHFYPSWVAASIDEWLYNGCPYELIVVHFLLGVACYGNLVPSMYPWIVVAYSALVAATTVVFLIDPIGQGRFSDSTK